MRSKLDLSTCFLPYHSALPQQRYGGRSVRTWTKYRTCYGRFSDRLATECFHRMRQTILQRLCTLAINRGILLTICQVMVPVMFFSNPERLYWYALLRMSSIPDIEGLVLLGLRFTRH